MKWILAHSGGLFLLIATLTAQGANEPDWTAPLNASSNYLPRWSPDGRQLAFDRRTPEGWRIQTIDADGKNLRQVSNGPGNDYQADWAPGGRSLAFDSDRLGNRDIYLMGVDDQATIRLTDARSRDVMPAWSPDGKRIAFVSDREDGQQIWIMTPDGGKPTRVTRGVRRGYILRPRWSPDGTKLAFAASDDHTGQRRLYAIRGDGSDLRPVTPPGDAANPSWDPTGTRLVFDATPEGKDDSSEGLFELFVVNADGSGLRRLTNNRVNDWGPSWSPDGRHIAFSRGMNDQYEIFRMSADGAEVKRLTFLVYR
jgi:Tol biopolymer transport system component